MWFFQENNIHAFIIQFFIQSHALGGISGHTGNRIEYQAITRLNLFQNFIKSFSSLQLGSCIGFIADPVFRLWFEDISFLPLYVLRLSTDTAISISSFHYFFPRSCGLVFILTFVSFDIINIPRETGKVNNF